MVSMSPYLIGEVLFVIVFMYLSLIVLILLVAMNWLMGSSHNRSLFLAGISASGVLFAATADVKIGTIFLVIGLLYGAIAYESHRLIAAVRNG